MNRDPARIDRILAALGELWRHHPDQRLGQLLLNFGYPSLPRPKDLQRAEDDQLEASLGVSLLQSRAATLRDGPSPRSAFPSSDD